MNAGRRHAWITGLGAVTPIGVGLPAFAEGLRRARSGVRPLGFTHPSMKSSVAAACAGFDPACVLAESELRRLPRHVPMALAAAREALARAGLDRIDTGVSRRIGLILGTGGGGIDFTLDQYAQHYSGGRPSLWTITNATHGNLAGELSIHLGLRGPSLCVSTGCASSSDAAGLALELLRSDRPGSPDAFVVVGADAHIRWEVLSTMELLRVISTRDFASSPELAPSASRPFDATRDGFVLGEGAWAMVVERPRPIEPLRERAGAPLAWLLGYGATCDAYHRVRPAPDAEEAARAITLAVRDAGLAPADVEVLHYHGTATPLNDRLETQTVKLAFGPHARRLRGHSVKSQIGHPQGASGLASLVATLAGLTGADGGGAFIPPTINLHQPDPECDLDYTPNLAAPTDARTALINCLAFGAKNSALVVRVERAEGLV
jgi:3-oxoacyl-[acyl-carrier-protein] synthase II